jgi:hypothetical protein
VAFPDELFSPSPRKEKPDRVRGLALFLEALLKLIQGDHEEENGVLPPQSEAMSEPEVRVRPHFQPLP